MASNREFPAGTVVSTTDGILQVPYKISPCWVMSRGSSRAPIYIYIASMATNHSLFNHQVPAISPYI